MLGCEHPSEPYFAATCGFSGVCASSRGFPALWVRSSKGTCVDAGGLVGEELEKAQAGPAPGSSSALDRAHVAKCTAGPCQAFWGEDGAEAWPTRSGGAGWDGSLPTACLCPCSVLMSELHNEKLLYFANRVRHPSPPLYARSGWPAEPWLPPSLSSAAFCNF